MNPHSWLYVDVTEPDGKVTNWRFELGAPNALFRLGWKKDTIPSGLEVVVTGFRAKFGGPVANVVAANWSPDSTRLVIEGYNRDKNLYGTWVALPNSTAPTPR